MLERADPTASGLQGGDQYMYLAESGRCWALFCSGKLERSHHDTSTRTAARCLTWRNAVQWCVVAGGPSVFEGRVRNLALVVCLLADATWLGAWEWLQVARLLTTLITPGESMVLRGLGHGVVGSVKCRDPRDIATARHWQCHLSTPYCTVCTCGIYGLEATSEANLGAISLTG